MRVESIPCLSDNYAYLLLDEATSEAVVVDPSEAEPVQRALQASGATLRQIWLTHHHWDHVNGVEALCDALAPQEVVGSAYDLDRGRIPRQTRGVGEGDRIALAGGEARIYEIPGHTLGAVAYLVGSMLFSGDTLFVGGCGRVFEGDMAMMQQSLAKLRELPDDTRIYCGHEYTVKNLKFARTLEPDNERLAEALQRAESARRRGEATVPGRLDTDRDINPFLRWDAPALQRAASELGASSQEAAEVFGALRRAKDRF